MTAPGFRVGVDIGGTFTDLVFARPDGRMDRRKVPTTPADYASAILDGIAGYCAEQGLDARLIAEVAHATTVATNAIVERKGARTALVTTEGFRDVLELRRIRVPLSYDLSWSKPAPLVPRALRLTVRERIDARGDVVEALDEAALGPLAEKLAAEGVEAIAVSLLHSYREPAHERAIGRHLRRALPGVHVSLSHEVLPEMLEYERTSTTVVNAYVAPLIARYLAALRDGLGRRGIDAPVLVMQSNGGLTSSGAAAERPAAIVESGPAAGVVAARRMARRSGYANVITLDMGGTTTKASIVEGGEFLRAAEYEVGSAMSASSRLGKGGGYLLRMPVIDVSEVGAGGGSIARLDPGGALRVGPLSAGAEPGPACYGRGNREPTVTDANLVLGFLAADSLAGGAFAVDPALALDAVAAAIARPAGIDPMDAAWGVHQVAVSNMVRAIKSVSVERGRDPAGFALVAFGGAGPIHAAAVARELGVRTVLIPPASGVFSSLGLLEAGIEHHATRTVLVGTSEASPASLESVLDGMRAGIDARVRADGLDSARVAYAAFADLRYRGQSSELSVPLGGPGVDADALAAAERAFEAEYERTFGHRGVRPEFELVTLRLVASLPAGGHPDHGWTVAPAAAHADRDCYFGPEVGRRRTPVVAREAIPSEPRDGPLIVQEYDTTVVVPPGSSAARDGQGNIVIRVGGRP